MSKRPVVSVIIPAYNEEERIGRCLEALARQDFQEPFEVIVVDNNSTDATAEIAASFAGRCTVRVVNERRQMRGAARARGCGEAEGEFLCSLDADAIPPPQWISSIVGALRANPDVVGVTHRAVIADCPPLLNLVCNAGMPVTSYIFRVLFGKYSLNGFSSGYRAEQYRSVGGYNPMSDACEDTELTFKLGKLGKTRFLLSPAITVSGRRFQQNGLVKGSWPYIRTTFEKFILGKQQVRLENLR